MTILDNTLIEIRPYWNGYTWVFDDDRVGLAQEPFVAGIPEMIDLMVKDVPNAKKGFRMTWAEVPFPTHTHTLEKISSEGGGTWYKMGNNSDLEGWLCPALFKYFIVAPKVIYLRADPLLQNKPWWRVW